MNVAVFASGLGSNFRAILDAVRLRTLPADVCLLLSNARDCGALSLGRERNVPTAHLSRKQFDSEGAFADAMLNALCQYGADFIALAGYLKHVPSPVVQAFRNRIVNIHPALLPAFGGHGMYGHFVHEAVIRSGAKVTGATVHIVDEEYDTGPIVAQRVVPVNHDDTPETLARRVLVVEHELYPFVLKAFAENRVVIEGPKAWIRE